MRPYGKFGKDTKGDEGLTLIINAIVTLNANEMHPVTWKRNPQWTEEDEKRAPQERARKAEAKKKAPLGGAQAAYDDGSGINYHSPDEDPGQEPKYIAEPGEAGSCWWWTSITANRNSMCSMHVDRGNCGPSYLFAVGDFIGGETLTLVDPFVPERDAKTALWIPAKNPDKYDHDVGKPIQLTENFKLTVQNAEGLDEFNSAQYGRIYLPCKRTVVKESFAHYDGRVPHCTAPFFASDFVGKQDKLAPELKGVDVCGHIPIDKIDAAYQFCIDNYTQAYEKENTKADRFVFVLYAHVHWHLLGEGTRDVLTSFGFTRCGLQFDEVQQQAMDSYKNISGSYTEDRGVKMFLKSEKTKEDQQRVKDRLRKEFPRETKIAVEDIAEELGFLKLCEEAQFEAVRRGQPHTWSVTQNSKAHNIARSWSLKTPFDLFEDQIRGTHEKLRVCEGRHIPLFCDPEKAAAEKFGLKLADWVSAEQVQEWIDYQAKEFNELKIEGGADAGVLAKKNSAKNDAAHDEAEQDEGPEDDDNNSKKFAKLDEDKLWGKRAARRAMPLTTKGKKKTDDDDDEGTKFDGDVCVKLELVTDPRKPFQLPGMYPDGRMCLSALNRYDSETGRMKKDARLLMPWRFDSQHYIWSRSQDLAGELEPVRNLLRYVWFMPSTMLEPLKNPTGDFPREKQWNSTEQFWQGKWIDLELLLKTKGFEPQEDEEERQKPAKKTGMKKVAMKKTVAACAEEDGEILGEQELDDKKYDNSKEEEEVDEQDGADDADNSSSAVAINLTGTTLEHGRWHPTKGIIGDKDNRVGMRQPKSTFSRNNETTNLNAWLRCPRPFSNEISDDRALEIMQEGIAGKFKMPEERRYHDNSFDTEVRDKLKYSSAAGGRDRTTTGQHREELAKESRRKMALFFGKPAEEADANFEQKSKEWFIEYAGAHFPDVDYCPMTLKVIDKNTGKVAGGKGRSKNAKNEKAAAVGEEADEDKTKNEPKAKSKASQGAGKQGKASKSAKQPDKVSAASSSSSSEAIETTPPLLRALAKAKEHQMKEPTPAKASSSSRGKSVARAAAPISRGKSLARSTNRGKSQARKK
eukprot:g14703.t1